jgi:hypothetical protein
MNDKKLSWEERKREWLDISIIDEVEFDANWEYQVKRQSRVPQPGEIAPDFELDLLDKDRKRTGKKVQLNALRGKPVALVFASYT